MSIQARFDGGLCEAEIRTGELIRAKHLDGKTMWFHDECPAGKWDSRPGVEVCTECWLEKPCPCDDEKGTGL
jgi:hypothetical protein